MPELRSAKSPPTRLRFKSAWDELDYLSAKIEYWWHDQKRPSKARAFCIRFEKLLRKLKDRPNSIMLQEYWTLLYEVKGRTDLAAQRCGREVQLLHRLLREGPVPPFDFEYLAETLIHLACLYLLEGQDQPARKALYEARDLAKRHGFPFEAANLLAD